MLTDEVATFGKNKMKISHLTVSLALIATTAACAAERAAGPHTPANTVASLASATATQVPLLYVVDGVRLQRDQVPNLTADQISTVRVVKGHTALRDYGPDASYGVVLITTKAAAPRA
jgi:hypothetical protein